MGDGGMGEREGAWDGEGARRGWMHRRENGYKEERAHGRKDVWEGRECMGGKE